MYLYEMLWFSIDGFSISSTISQVNRVGGGAQLLGTLEYANMQKMLLS